MSEITPNQVLMNNVDKLTHVLLIGINKEGKLHMETSHPTYQFVNYMLNRANFNINYMETNAQIEAEANKTMNAEAAVAEAVAKNVEAEMETVRPKRGRPKRII